MRNTSFFEKLTGSLRLSEDDLSALSESEENQKIDPKITKSSKPNDDDFEIIDDGDDFVIPEDAEIETIEEIIEDDTIDEEEVEEYYEEIIDEDEEDEIETEAPSEIEESIPKAEEESNDEDLNDNYPVFHLSKDMEDDADKVEDIKKSENLEKPKTLEQIQLPVDVFEMHNEVVLRILVPGITPENLKVSITRDHVSISCTRPTPEGIKDTSYFEREIPYGDFTRMIHLPSDVDVEHAEAVEKYGLLIIRLPMLDAKKVQELKIRSV